MLDLQASMSEQGLSPEEQQTVLQEMQYERDQKALEEMGSRTVQGEPGMAAFPPEAPVPGRGARQQARAGGSRRSPQKSRRQKSGR